MPASRCAAHPAKAPRAANAVDRWCFDAGQQMLLLRGAVARHLTGRGSCRLRLDEFRARISGADEHDHASLVDGPPPARPIELRLLDSTGQPAMFGFTVASTGCRRQGLVQPLAVGSGSLGEARRSAFQRLQAGLEGCTSALLILLHVEEAGYLGAPEPPEALIDRIGHRLRRVGDVRLACRLSEDVLAVLVEGADPGRATELVRSIGHGRLAIEGIERLAALAGGVAIYPIHGRGCGELCRAASMALGSARRGGRMAVTVYDDTLAAAVTEQRTLEAGLRGALARGELALCYQPIIDLQQRQLHGVEVLLRWQHPHLGPISPERFVPLLEELGLIQPVTEWLIDRCASDLAPLLAEMPELRVNLNLAAAQVEPRQMAALLGRLAPLGWTRITLEITERAVLDAAPAVEEAIASCKARGVEIALDDFGTGYSSLAYLERYAIDTVKIDKSFVARLEQDGRLADAILGMAGALRLKPVAEGVETFEQLAWLAARGCRYVQGFLFSVPLDPDGLRDYAGRFRFPSEQLDAALWPRARALPRLLSDNQEQALRLFVRHVPAAVAMFDTEMRYLVASDRWLDDYDLAERAIVGRRHYDVLPDTPARWREVHARCLAEGSVERSDEDFYLRPDGTREWLRWEVHPFRNRLGDVAGIIIVSEFVTARKEAERRLAESEQRLREVLANSSDWLWETDHEHRLVFDSDNRAKSNVDPARLIGHTRWGLAGVEDPHADPAWRSHLADLAARRPFRGFEYSARDEAGRLVHFEVSGTPILDEAGEFRGYRGTASNITARKEAERRLAESEQRLRDYLATASDWAWEMDASLRFTGFSGNFERHGYRGSRTVGKTRWEAAGVADPEADPLWREHKRDLEARRPFRNMVFRGRTAAGGEAWFEASGLPIFNADGEFCGYRGTARDVTLARLAELERRRQHEHLRLAGELAGLGYWEGDRESGAVFWSEGLYRITGRDPATFRPSISTPFCIFHPDDRPYVTEVVETAVAEARAFEFRARMQHPDGTIRHVISRGQPRPGPDGRARVYFGIVQDVTEQVAAQLALEARSRENELYRAMIDVLPDYIFAKDRQGRFLAANAATARLMGVQLPGDLIGRTDWDFYPPEIAGRFEADEATLLARGETMIVEQPCRREDGSAGWLCSLKTPLRDEAGQVIGYVGHGRDITEEKEAHQEIRRLKAEAESARDMLHQATSVLTDGFALFDPADRLVHCNAAFAELHDLPPAHLVGRSFLELQQLAAGLADLEGQDGGREAWLAERVARHERADGTPFEIWFRGEAFSVREQRTPDGSIVLLQAHVTHLKRVEHELRRLATVDTLTGAFNRRHFLEQGERLLKDSRETGEPVALLLIDIDHFKRVNDTWGHAAGDEALRQVCRVCLQRLRPGDLFARWGGEEFVLMLPRTDGMDALRIADRLRRGVEALTLLAARAEFRVTLSVGIAIGRPADTLDTLARRADRGLYAAKSAGRNRAELIANEPVEAVP